MSEWICEVGCYCSDKAEPIIRCRDCRHYKTSNSQNIRGKFCHWFSEFEELGSETVLTSAYLSCPDDFCSWAEGVDQ